MAVVDASVWRPPDVRFALGDVAFGVGFAGRGALARIADGVGLRERPRTKVPRGRAGGRPRGTDGPSGEPHGGSRGARGLDVVGERARSLKAVRAWAALRWNAR